MSEPVITPAAVYSLGGAMVAGQFLGMPVDSVAIGAMATAAVAMIGEPKSRWLVVSYVIIGGLLGGAIAPPIVHFMIGEAGVRYPHLEQNRTQFAQVFAPAAIGLLWQFVLKIARVLWPTFEQRADDVVDWILSLRISRRNKE